MKRLVYAPRIDAYVKLDDDSVIDISPYVIRGEVGRVVDAVSTLNLSLRNPNKRFTTPGNPLIRPMDPISVTLTRLKDRPIEVFTGYVDESPYLALYPGEVTLQASCTLKRLQYTYFDAGLPFFNEFLKARGWQSDGKFGVNSMAKSNNAYNTKGELKDPGLGTLIYDVLTEIGQWPKDEIFIEDLPDGIVDRVVELFNESTEETKANQKDFMDFLEKILSASSLGGAVAGGGASGDSTGEGAFGDVDLGNGAWKPATLTYYKPSAGGINGREGGGAAGVPIYDNTWGCAAGSGFPFGTLVAVRYKGKHTVVPVLDRGGAVGDGHFDLLPGPAKAIGVSSGKGSYKIVGHRSIAYLKRVLANGKRPSK